MVTVHDTYRGEIMMERVERYRVVHTITTIIVYSEEVWMEAAIDVIASFAGLLWLCTKSAWAWQ